MFFIAYNLEHPLPCDCRKAIPVGHRVVLLNNNNSNQNSFLPGIIGWITIKMILDSKNQPFFGTYTNYRFCVWGHQEKPKNPLLMNYSSVSEP